MHQKTNQNLSIRANLDVKFLQEYKQTKERKKGKKKKKKKKERRDPVLRKERKRGVAPVQQGLNEEWGF